MNKISQRINDIYRDHKDSYNIESIYYGEKETNGQKTGQDAIIFSVKEKIPPGQLSRDSEIPSILEINGNRVLTDVVVEDIEYEFESQFCFDPVANSNILSRHRAYTQTRRGGMSVTNLTTAINKFPEKSANAVKLGTLGGFAIDRKDGKLVAVSNNHVFTPDFLTAADQGSNHYNWKEHKIVCPGDHDVKLTMNNTTVHPGPGINEGREFMLGVVKRSWPLTRAGNQIDAAICSISHNVVNQRFPPGVTSRNSYIPIGMDIDYAPEFATASEIDNITPDVNLFKSSLTTGPVGEPVSKESTVCELFTDSKHFAGRVSKKGFTDLIRYKGRSGIDPSAGGDSGSFLYADINGTWKIIGIHFAGGRDRASGAHHALACRIDIVSRDLEIDAWTNQRLDYATGNPPDHSYSLNPEYAVVEGHRSEPYLMIGGKKYWQVGRTGDKETHQILTGGQVIPKPE